MNLDLSFYFAIFLRRLHYFIVILTVVSAAAIAAAFLLPPVYQARSLLLVESSQIPGALAAPTVQAAALEKLQTIENRLMTRANLLEIAKKLKVLQDMDKMSPDDIVQSMRDNTIIAKSAGKGMATMMTLTFSGETGQIAAGVVNEYVTLILQEDVSLRTRGAEETLEFFEQEVKSLSGELDQMSAKILDFQNKNSDALPTTLSYRLSQQSLLQSKIDTEERNIAQLEDQKEQLVLLYNTTGQVAASTANMTPEAKQLAATRDQLTQSLAIYAPGHPKIKLLEAQIIQLEAIVKAQAPVTAGTASNPSATMLDVQLADINSRIAASEVLRDQLREQMTVLQDTIDRTPANQIALDALNRDYANIQQQYNTAVNRQSQAAAGERIEVLSKGERISVLDAATVPNSPAKPNRPLIAGGGVLAGTLLGLGFIVLLEVLNRSVRRPTDLIRSFGITPIATIPYMMTPSEVMMRRSGFAALLLLAVVGIPALIYAVHVLYQPLDIIMARVAAQFGIRL